VAPAGTIDFPCAFVRGPRQSRAADYPGIGSTMDLAREQRHGTRNVVAVVTLALVVLAALALLAQMLWLAGDLPFVPSSSRHGERDGDGGAGDSSAASVHHQAGPLSSAQLGVPLVRGAWVTACGAPDTMKVVVKLDVKMGRAVKVDVRTDPPDPTVSACIDHAARDLRWDVSPKTDHVTVTY
jgi:hypothetical protein